MSETPAIGRHRTPGRHNPLTEIAGMVGRAGEHGVKATAVVAASGGLVAAFALPAQAATSTVTKATPQAAAFLAATTTAKAAQAPQAAPAAVVAAPAVVAPAAAAPVASETVGVVGVSATEKPAPPPPPPAPIVAQVSSAGSNAAPTNASSPAAVASAVAPAVAANVPASVGGGVLGVAAAYSGIWYVYGGSTPAGFDCSGFTQFVFGQAGVSIPRTATAQMFATTRVSNPQPGDLVFFGDASYAYHVGIYAGNGMMYDSPRTGATSGLHAIWSSQVIYGRV